MKVSNYTAGGLIVFLLTPILFLLQRVTSFRLPEVEEILWALNNSIIQAAGSALLALFLGFLLSQGLLWWNQKQLKSLRGLLEVICLMPGMLPALFTILFFLSLLNPFPMGLIGVILIQGVIYSGFIAVAWIHILEEKAIGVIEASFVLGARRWQVLLQLIKMLKMEILSLLSFVFSLCFVSFAVPVTIGGGRGTTLEVLIYEKIRLSDGQSGEWNQALTLSFIQVLFLFLFSLLQRRGILNSSSRTKVIPLIGTGFGFGVLAVFVATIFFGFLFFTLSGWGHVFKIAGLTESVLEVLPATLLISLAGGFGIYVLLLLTAYGAIIKNLRRFLIGYVAPSTTLTGFALIYFRPESRFIEIILFVTAFCILVLASLYRMGFDQQLLGLSRQIETAKIFGANEWLMFKEIIFPQVHKIAARLGGVAGLWVAGDFALSKIVFSSDVTLAQVVDGLMTSYRIEAASALMGIVVVIGIVVYLIFAGFGNVLNRKT